MGLFHSKKNYKDKRESVLPPNQTQNFDDESVNRLRKELNENPDMFAVNNMLMSVQFYENFDREMADFRKNQVSDREIELNKALAEYQKHCLLPDTIMENVNERVRFKPYHEQKEIESEPLLHQRMFIIHDNIEILYEGETSEYSTVDGPIYRAVLERTENQGYVQLRQVEFLNVGKNDEDSDTEIKIDESSKEKSVSFNTSSQVNSPTEKERLFKRNPSSPSTLKETQFVFSENVSNDFKKSSETKRSSLKNKLFYNHSFTIQSPKNSIKIKKSGSVENIKKEVEASTSTGTEADYGYTTLQRLTASKPLDEFRPRRNVSGISGIPAYCIKEIKTRKIFNDDIDDDSDDSLTENGRRKEPKRKKIEDFYDYKKYFDSSEFVGHFSDVYAIIYPVLGFSEESFLNAMLQRSTIYCKGLDKNGNKTMYEVIPSVGSSWPEIAFEWDMRKRPEISDPTTKRIYQWPTKLMSKKIKMSQVNVLPVGFVAKRGINKNQDLEWSLSFSAAERYMQTCMSHSQIRCYLFIIALYKTFMEPTNTKLGLTPYHILNLIFWQCEKNYLTWPEAKLGTKMIKILNLLYNYLSKGVLPDYFVRDRNLFESLPSKYLRISQSKLHDIIERPAVHVLLALRNLRYTNDNFFPSLNFKNLYAILSNNDSLALLNPTLAIFVENNADDENPEERNEYKENTVSFWKSVKKSESDRERQWKRNLRKQLEIEKNKQENLKRKTPIDPIDLQIKVSKLDYLKKRCLLEFFMLHFLDVANKSFQYHAYSYAITVLEHTFSLATLLAEEPSGELEARSYKMKISEIMDKCRREQKKIDNNINSSNLGAVKFNIAEHHNINTNNLDENVILRKKKIRPENLIISADIHSADTTSPAKSTPSQISIHLEENETLNNSTDL